MFMVPWTQLETPHVHGAPDTAKDCHGNHHIMYKHGDGVVTDHNHLQDVFMEIITWSQAVALHQTKPHPHNWREGSTPPLISW